MRALYPLVAAALLAPLALMETSPLAGPTADLCARSPLEITAYRATEAARITTQWTYAAGFTPMFIASPACAWRCPGPNRCADNMMGLLRYTCYDPAAQLGMNAPDRRYYDDTHARLGGRMMKVPDSLMQAARDFPMVKEFKQELARLGYKYVDFASTSVSNPPAGYKRVLILVETDEFDQWYQIATFDTYPRTLARNVDMGVSQKKDESGRTLSPQPFFMNGYSRGLPARYGATAASPWVQEGLGGLFGLNRCVMCHPSGLRGIFPVPGSVAPEEAETLRYIQQKTDATITSDFGGYYDSTRLGPTMGAVDPPSRPELLARCAAGMPAPSISRIAHAMNCATCHDGKFRGRLQAGTDYATIAHKILGATPDGIMPPREELSAKERQLVSMCLKLEYKDKLESWLQPTRCSATEPKCALQ